MFSFLSLISSYRSVPFTCLQLSIGAFCSSTFFLRSFTFSRSLFILFVFFLFPSLSSALVEASHCDLVAICPSQTLLPPPPGPPTATVPSPLGSTTRGLQLPCSTVGFWARTFFEETLLQTAFEGLLSCRCCFRAAIGLTSGSSGQDSTV